MSGWWGLIAAYGSGMCAGFLVCWYWLVKPMAELLGWETQKLAAQDESLAARSPSRTEREQ